MPGVATAPKGAVFVSSWFLTSGTLQAADEHRPRPKGKRMNTYFQFRAMAGLVFGLTVLLAGAVILGAAETYHGNGASRIYHNSRCKYFTCKKCTIVFLSAQEAQKAGYRPCKVCKG